jgi:hypothetical protein
MKISLFSISILLLLIEQNTPPSLYKQKSPRIMEEMSSDILDGCYLQINRGFFLLLIPYSFRANSKKSDFYSTTGKLSLFLIPVCLITLLPDYLITHSLFSSTESVFVSFSNRGTNTGFLIRPLNHIRNLRPIRCLRYIRYYRHILYHTCFLIDKSPSFRYP